MEDLARSFQQDLNVHEMPPFLAVDQNNKQRQRHQQQQQQQQQFNVLYPFLNFAATVHRNWIKSVKPSSVIDIFSFCDVQQNVRLPADQFGYTWSFNFSHRSDKTLRNVALALEKQQPNFQLQRVLRNNVEIGRCNLREWFDDNGYDTSANEMVHYKVFVSFFALEYGTYRQNVFFGFNSTYPVYMQRLCVDRVPREDVPRLEEATKYVLSQNPTRLDIEKVRFHPFHSPFVPSKDPRAIELDKLYPYPTTENFMLTHATLTENSLTPSNYKGRLHELVVVEELARHEQIARYNGMVQLLPLSCYVLTNADGSTTAKYAPPGESFAQLPLGRGVTEDTKSGRLLLRSCNSIYIRFPRNKSNDVGAEDAMGGVLTSPTSSSQEDRDNTETVYEAHVEDKCNHTVFVRLSKECVTALSQDENINVKIEFILSRLSFCEWHLAIDFLQINRIIFPDIHYHNFPEQSVLDLNRNWNWLLLDKRLNEKQRRAISMIAAPSDIILPPILLLGPFGTGKTFTIAQALCVLLIESSKNKVVLCTQSNSAADLYVKEFFDSWYLEEKNERLKPIRIYYKGRARNTVHHRVLAYSLMDQNGRFRDPTQEDIEDCGLIITTLATAGCLTSLDLVPTHIVIDEAAQALECEILTPLALANERTRVILAGDQMQLAPEIYSELAKERGLGISLLERLHQLYPSDHPCRVHLCQSYRSHTDIVKLTSDLFYAGDIESGSLLPVHPTLTPLTFYAVEGMEQQDLHSTGFFNHIEACELAKQVANLRKSWPTKNWGKFDESSIGVLAHYSEQVQRIRVELRKRKLANISVEKVLNVQGKQFTAIFISTVRTRHCCRYSAESNISDYGFLTNPRLLNTAITRAKCLVAVVGDPIALLTVGSCRTLWRKYLEKSTLHGIDSVKLKRHLSTIPELPPMVPLNPLAQEFVPRHPNSLAPLYVEYIPISLMYPVVRPCL